MNAKNTLTALCSALTLILATGGVACAATTPNVYSSGLLVLVFIGFVALVVVVQMIPAIITMCGMLKALFGSKDVKSPTKCTNLQSDAVCGSSSHLQHDVLMTCVLDLHQRPVPNSGAAFSNSARAVERDAIDREKYHG